ncbi:hypothetical protein [Campylobacter fetus]|uniref:hypothetical protein n=1 Tax=Campylobacter fetus TaxID=196 RepID=UPI00122F77BA|nr:hypothetical protein [Campylobacter fetus]KAA3684592.1 hypothetical protein E3U42_09795 [Campylobacter fetus subsp. fetus]
MEHLKYQNYSERKLFNALNNTRATIAKIKTEKEKIEKKLDDYLEREKIIKIVLANKIMPSEELKRAIKEVENGEVETFTSHDEAMGYLNADD